MQTQTQIHNASLIAEAMAQQNIATRAQVAYDALGSLLNLNYEQFVEPIDTLGLYKAQEILEKFVPRKMQEDLIRQIQ